jgi:hypothetical protein
MKQIAPLGFEPRSQDDFNAFGISKIPNDWPLHYGAVYIQNFGMFLKVVLVIGEYYTKVTGCLGLNPPKAGVTWAKPSETLSNKSSLIKNLGILLRATVTFLNPGSTI